MALRKLSNIACILLVTLLLVNVFSLSIVRGYYELNKEAIIENRCVNKEITSVQCFGKCFLGKTIGIAKKAKAENSKQLKTGSLSVEYLPTNEVVLQTPDSEHQIVFFIPRVFALLEGYFFSDYQPPRC